MLMHLTSPCKEGLWCCLGMVDVVFADTICIHTFQPGVGKTTPNGVQLREIAFFRLFMAVLLFAMCSVLRPCRKALVF